MDPSEGSDESPNGPESFIRNEDFDPTHLFLCECLSSILGVRCCAELLVWLMLNNKLSSAGFDTMMSDLEIFSLIERHQQ